MASKPAPARAIETKLRKPECILSLYDWSHMPANKDIKLAKHLRTGLNYYAAIEHDLLMADDDLKAARRRISDLEYEIDTLIDDRDRLFDKVQAANVTDRWLSKLIAAAAVLVVLVVTLAALL